MHKHSTWSGARCHIGFEKILRYISKWLLDVSGGVPTEVHISHSSSLNRGGEEVDVLYTFRFSGGATDCKVGYKAHYINDAFCVVHLSRRCGQMDANNVRHELTNCFWFCASLEFSRVTFIIYIF